MADGVAALESSLTEEVGGVPVWVIGTGVGAVIGLGVWLFKRNQGGGVVANVYDPASADTTEPADPQNSDYGLPNGPAGDWLADNPGSTAFPVGGAALPSPITNGQWAKQAIDGLLAKGDDPSLVTNAITKYLNGAYLTAAEQAIVRLALQTYGSTPEGAIALNTTAPPTAVTPLGNRGYGWTKVQAGDTPQKIASRVGISLATYYFWNGAARLKVGTYKKFRSRSNPLVGPYNGV